LVLIGLGLREQEVSTEGFDDVGRVGAGGPRDVPAGMVDVAEVHVVGLDLGLDENLTGDMERAGEPQFDAYVVQAHHEVGRGLEGGRCDALHLHRRIGAADDTGKELGSLGLNGQVTVLVRRGPLAGGCAVSRNPDSLAVDSG
jgi:hypothetical protein